MKNLHATLILSMLITFSLPFGARAQSDHPPGKGKCDCPLVRLDDAYRNATIVFEGVPLSVDTIMPSARVKIDGSDAIGRVMVRFAVDRRLKGEGEGPITVTTGLGKDVCAFAFLPSEHYIVFASVKDGVLQTDRCMPTRAFDTVSEGFRDSLEYVRSGHLWESGVPVEAPKR